MTSSAVDTKTLSQFATLTGALASSGMVYATVGGKDYQITIAQLVAAMVANGIQPILTNGMPASAVGNIGQIAIDPTNGLIYAPKTASGWATGVDLVAGGLNADGLTQLKPVIAAAVTTAISAMTAGTQTANIIPVTQSDGTLDGSFIIGAIPQVTPSLRVDFARARDYPTSWTMTRSSQDTILGSTNYLTTVLANNPKYLYGPDQVCRGLLVEPIVKNWCTYSRDMTGTGWIVNAATVSRSTTVLSMDGSTYAQLVTETATTAEHSVWSPPMGVLALGPLSASVYVKPNGRTQVHLYYNGAGGTGAGDIQYDFVSGTVTVLSGATGGRMIALNNGWYRLEYFAKAVTNAADTLAGQFHLGGQINGVQSYTGDGVSGFYVDYWQIEQTLSPTQPIATSASTANKSADTYRIPAADWIGINQASFVIEGVLPANYQSDGANTELFRIWDYNSTTNYIAVYLTTGGVIEIDQYSGGTSTFSVQGAAVQTRAGRFKIGYSYGPTGGGAFAVNGSSAVGAGSTTQGVCPTMVAPAAYLGKQNQGVVFSGMKFYRTILTAAQLQYLTTL